MTRVEGGRFRKILPAIVAPVALSVAASGCSEQKVQADLVRRPAATTTTIPDTMTTPSPQEVIYESPLNLDGNFLPNPTESELHPIFRPEVKNEFHEPYVALRGNIVGVRIVNSELTPTRFIVKAANAPWNFTVFVRDERIVPETGTSWIREMALDAMREGKDVEFKVPIAPDPVWEHALEEHVLRPEADDPIGEIKTFREGYTDRNREEFSDTSVDGQDRYFEIFHTLITLPDNKQ